MTKIRSLLLLCLFLIVSTISYAQVYMETFAISIGEWDYKKKDWNWEPMIYENLTFTLNGDIITVNDAASSMYVTYAQFTDDKYSTSWRAVDEDDTSCIIGMSREGEYPFTIYIMYDNIIYKYYFKQ